MDWPLMTEDELHEFGIISIVDALASEGVEIKGVNKEKRLYPQIIGTRWGSAAHIVVRTACLPAKGELTREEFFEAQNFASSKGATAFFASVGIACVAYPDKTPVINPEHLCLPIRDAGFAISYEGLLLMGTQVANSVGSLGIPFNSESPESARGSVSPPAQDPPPTMASRGSSKTRPTLARILQFANDTFVYRAMLILATVVGVTFGGMPGALTGLATMFLVAVGLRSFEMAYDSPARAWAASALRYGAITIIGGVVLGSLFGGWTWGWLTAPIGFLAGHLLSRAHFVLRSKAFMRSDEGRALEADLDRALRGESKATPQIPGDPESKGDGGAGRAI